MGVLGRPSVLAPLVNSLPNIPHVEDCLRISIAVKTHHDHSNSYKGEHLIWDSLQLQIFRPLLSGGKQGSMQADMVLERKLRVLHLDPQATGNELSPTLSVA